MKIQIDTENKIIKLFNNEKLSKLTEVLEKLLPNKEWKNFTLETNVIIEQWSNPIIIREYPNSPYPYPFIWTTAGNNLTSIYNVEIRQN